MRARFRRCARGDAASGETGQIASRPKQARLRWRTNGRARGDPWELKEAKEVNEVKEVKERTRPAVSRMDARNCFGRRILYLLDFINLLYFPRKVPESGFNCL